MTPKRTYVSPLREQTAAHTREVILLRATELFAERGYGRVAVADIAAAAGVSPPTVFTSIGSKGALLNRIVEDAVMASGHEESLRRLLVLQTPGKVLAALAADTRAGNESQFAVHQALHKAMPVYEDADKLWELATGAYRETLAASARHLHSLDPALPGTTKGTADLLWYWFGPASWRTLVVENGWSWRRAEKFLRETATTTLTHELVRDSS
ncbi:TetR family transcriptional regulator [Streptomyces sp. NPDC088847]|uniref:TetR family transcriptional regulator n=1 Tax=Streptomyces sp. NPDC088847 TaxID=3365909 RepID=UPI003823FEDC